MTESLAKGLTTRFFNELESGIAPMREKFLTAVGGKKITRKNWRIVSNIAQDCFSDYALEIYEGGSERKPYISLNLLLPIESRRYNSWDEKCLTGNATVINLVPFLIHSLPVPYNISEHTIARLFLRSHVPLDGGLVDIHAIKLELAYIPFWASLWGLFINTENLFGQCSIAIPSQSGLFFAQTFAAGKGIEIRTFVGDHQLSESQLLMKRAMVEASGNLLNTPLSSFTVLENLKIDETGTVNAYACRKLLFHEKIEAILMAITNQDTAKLDDRTLRERFIQYLGRLAGDLPETYFEIFDTLGIREGKKKLQLQKR